MKYATLVPVLVALLPGGMERTQAGVTFDDGTFNDASWTVASSHDLLSAGLVPSGGNPGSYRQTQISFNEQVDYAVQLNTTFLFNPATQGAITGLTWESDSITTNARGGVQYALIQQAGVLYFDSAVTEGATSNVWLHFTQTLNLGDFIRLDGAAGNPDFTSTGSPIEFGYLINVVGGGFFESDTGIDNYSMTVAASLPDITAVPEPGTFTLWGLGMTILAAWRWRAKKRSLLPVKRFAQSGTDHRYSRRCPSPSTTSVPH